MRRTHTCPKCEGVELIVADPWGQPDHDSSNVVVPMQVAVSIDWRTRAVATDLELWVCAACGYAETYAKDVATLRGYADSGVDGIRRVVKQTDGAYR